MRLLKILKKINRYTVPTSWVLSFIGAKLYVKMIKILVRMGNASEEDL